MPASVDLATPPVPIQGVPGAGYNAIDLRRALQALGKEGVVDINDMKVTQRAAGAGLAVDVSVGQALVQGDTVPYQGLYYALLETALTGATEITATSGHATLPRVDAVYLEIKDDFYDSSGLNKGTVRYAAGTATATAQASNPSGAGYLLGAPTIPNTALVLAYIQMAAAASTVPTASIFDARVSSRPAFQLDRSIVVPGTIGLPSGEVNVIPGFFVPVAAGDRVFLKAMRYRVASGTVRFKIQRNAVDVPGTDTGGGAGDATATAQTLDFTDVELTNNDFIQVVPTALTGTPMNLSITLILEHVIV